MPNNPLHLALLKLSEKIGRALRQSQDQELSYPDALELLGSLEDDISDLANTLTESLQPVCEYCGIEADDPLVKQPCASGDGRAALHKFPNGTFPPDDRDDAYERAASRARGNDFEESGGKDWT